MLSFYLMGFVQNDEPCKLPIKAVPTFGVTMDIVLKVRTLEDMKKQGAGAGLLFPLSGYVLRAGVRK